MYKFTKMKKSFFTYTHKANEECVLVNLSSNNLRWSTIVTPRPTSHRESEAGKPT